MYENYFLNPFFGRILAVYIKNCATGGVLMKVEVPVKNKSK